MEPLTQTTSLIDAVPGAPTTAVLATEALPQQLIESGPGGAMVAPQAAELPATELITGIPGREPVEPATTIEAVPTAPLGSRENPNLVPSPMGDLVNTVNIAANTRIGGPNDNNLAALRAAAADNATPAESVPIGDALLK